jgi:fructose-specific component phosphotransferase system IIB-like protein
MFVAAAWNSEEPLARHAAGSSMNVVLDFELTRGHSSASFENPREVGLVGKSVIEGDIHQAHIPAANLLAGVVDTQSPYVLAHGATIVPRKRSRQMNGVHA